MLSASELGHATSAVQLPKPDLLVYLWSRMLIRFVLPAGCSFATLAGMFSLATPRGFAPCSSSLGKNRFRTPYRLSVSLMTVLQSPNSTNADDKFAEVVVADLLGGYLLWPN